MSPIAGYSIKNGPLEIIFIQATLNRFIRLYLGIYMEMHIDMHISIKKQLLRDHAFD